MADLLTLAELKTALNIDVTDNRKDDLYSQILPWATLAIQSYTERDFGAPLVTEERTFEYDGSGYLDIDDAASVTQVKMLVPHGTDIILDPLEWMAAPTRRDDSPVYYYIVMPGYVGPVMGDPAMGFTRNLDLYAAEGRLRALPPMVKVTATWGWPVIPGDVKLAAVWTITDWTTKDSGENLTSESIEGWSRSWGSRSGGTVWGAIPNRARDLLASYQKQRI